MRNLQWDIEELVAFNRHIAEQDARIRELRDRARYTGIVARPR